MAGKFWKPAIGVLLLGGALVLGVWGAMDLRVLTARQAMEQWTTGERVLTLTDWKGVRDRLEQATKYNPLKADYWMDLGRAYEWRARYQGLGTRAAVIYQQTATSAYRKATSVRSAWGPGWASLAQSKALVLGRELDRETFVAMDRALVLGSWEPEVQEKIIWVAMVAWDRLDEGLQARVITTIKRVLANFPDYLPILKMASDLYWERNIQGLLWTQDQRSRLQAHVRQRRGG